MGNKSGNKLWNLWFGAPCFHFGMSQMSEMSIIMIYYDKYWNLIAPLSASRPFYYPVIAWFITRRYIVIIHNLSWIQAIITCIKLCNTESKTVYFHSEESDNIKINNYAQVRQICLHWSLIHALQPQISSGHNKEAPRFASTGQMPLTSKMSRHFVKKGSSYGQKSCPP